MTYAAGEPSWFDLMTPKLSEVRPFYAALLGWEYRDQGPGYGGYVMASVDGQSAAGLGPAPAGGAQSSWTVYFDSPDIGTSAQQVRELGGQVVVGPHQVGEQGHMAICTDPDGATFGLWQAGVHRGAQHRDAHGSVAWCEVNTHDAGPARDFYAQLLGATAEAIPDMAYFILKHGERQIAGVSGSAVNWEAVTPAPWVVYFRVDDVDQAAQVAQDHRGTVLVPPFDSPYGRMAVLADPAGTAFSVMKPPSMPA